MSDFDKPDHEEDSLIENADSFAKAMRDTVPIKHDKVNLRTRPSPKKRQEKEYHRTMATQESGQIIDGLSTDAVNIVESNQELFFAAAGVQIKVMKRLRKGHIPWEEGIDLHGMTVEDARNELSDFIRSAYYKGCHSVLVIHGKSYSASGQQPLLKSYTNDWLRQLHEVLAFCSAQPKDGGAGAIYVLLRKAKS